MARFGIEKLGMAKITAGIYDTKIGSAKALLKAGSTLQATITSHAICGVQSIASQIYGLDHCYECDRSRYREMQVISHDSGV